VAVNIDVLDLVSAEFNIGLLSVSNQVLNISVVNVVPANLHGGLSGLGHSQTGNSV